jgi:CheY-like chemotaxis protein
VRSDKVVSGTPIILLTSGDRPGHITLCEKLGIDAHILKPVHQAELFQAVVAALQVSTPTDAWSKPGETVTSARIRPLRILLAEDSVINQRLAVGLLKNHGHSVTVANTGKEAIDALDEGSFDLVLMDVQMPEMDGFQATKVIREAEKASGAHVPIIAMTAHAMKGDRERCLGSGMDDYISKPIRSQLLYEKLARFYTESSEGEDSSRAAAPPGVDWRGAQKSCDFDDALLHDAVTAFLEESTRSVEEIRAAIRNGDSPHLHRTAHSLRTSAGFFTSGRLCQHAEQLEARGREGDMSDANQLLAALCEELTRVTEELQAHLSGIDQAADA